MGPPRAVDLGAAEGRKGLVVGPPGVGGDSGGVLRGGAVAAILSSTPVGPSAAPRPAHGRPVGRSWATNPSQLIVIAPPWTLRTQSRPNEQRRSHRQKEFRLSSGLPTIYRHRSGKIRWALRDLRRCLYGFRSPGTAPRAVAESLGGALLPPGATPWQMSRKTESVLWLDQRWHTMASDAFSEPPGAGPGAGRIGARRVSAISRSFEGPQSGSLRPIV